MSTICRCKEVRRQRFVDYFSCQEDQAPTKCRLFVLCREVRRQRCVDYFSCPEDEAPTKRRLFVLCTELRRPVSTESRRNPARSPGSTCCIELSLGLAPVRSGSQETWSFGSTFRPHLGPRTRARGPCVFLFFSHSGVDVCPKLL